MFYTISKLIGFFLTSLRFLVGLGVIGILLLVTRFQRLAKTLMAASLLLIAAVGFLPVGTALTLPLEQRFPPWKDVGVAPAGVIVLGGALISQARQGFALNESAERIVTGILLAQKYPDALLVFTGGGDDPRQPRESDISARLAEQMGVSKDG